MTGGGGFLGGHVCRALLAAGHAVRVLERLPPRSLSGVELIPGDVAERDVLDRAVPGVDVVVHLACSTVPQTSEEDPTYDVRSNIESSVRLMASAVRYGVRRFVFASSGGTVYGIPDSLPVPETHATRPISCHGAMKLAIENYLWTFSRQYGLGGVALRMANPYGPGQRGPKPQGVIGALLGRIATNSEFEVWGDGTIVRDYVFAADVARAFVRAVECEGAAGPINIGSGRGASIVEVIAVVERAVGRRIRVRHLPTRRLDVPANVLDPARAQRELGWAPTTTLEEGVRQTLLAI